MAFVSNEDTPKRFLYQHKFQALKTEKTNIRLFQIIG